ncbi:uncharacterized protein LOC113318521 [Papaver somniferum]|uniref:uncharacterized protein LOC113318521 n=1 Tax=Papaver somniferum TaxID=3469 RepID=UPI000E6FF111|nr:uncharacterized protein LOC113318521 [Papaver somniferum]
MMIMMEKIETNLNNQDEQYTLVVYKPTPLLVHWNEREEQRLVLDMVGWELAENVYESEPSFLRGHLRYSHPYIVRPAAETVPPQAEPPSTTPEKLTVPVLQKTLTLVENWETGLNARTRKERC